MSAQPLEIRMAHLEGAYEQISERLGGVEARLLALDQKMDSRFDAVDRRFTAMDGRFAAMEGRFEGFDRKLTAILITMVSGTAAIVAPLIALLIHR